MLAQPHPLQEARLAALRTYAILDTPAEKHFDDVVKLASQICETPMSFVSFVDAGRHWFKARKGLDAQDAPLEASVCSHAILQNDIMIVPDTRLDPRTADNPLTTEGFGDGRRMLFYAGARIDNPDGLPLGALCVIDTRPRHLTELQKSALAMLARNVEKQLDLRLALRREAEARAQLEQTSRSLQASLAAQKVLTREIDHRVKNSLAMVAAMVRMQGARAVAPEARSALSQASQRIAAIASLHQELYETGGLETVKLSHFMVRVGELLSQSLPDNVRLDIDVEDVALRYVKASAIASIVNEFAANSTKHAFPDGRDGVVSIRGKVENGRYRVDLADDGIGEAAPSVRANVAGAESSGLGRRLIAAAMTQLEAVRATPSEGPGARLSFTFPTPP